MAQGSVGLMQRGQGCGEWAGRCKSSLGDAERPGVTWGCSDKTMYNATGPACAGAALCMQDVWLLTFFFRKKTKESVTVTVGVTIACAAEAF